ncbi:MAG: class I SAM-dependent methyltransferase [Solirubrobacteraceae bacterium]
METVDDCYFYHAMDIPGHGFVSGSWDLRGREDEYLGGTSFANCRVLEIGPASGYLTFHIERCGGRVVAIDLPAGHNWNMVPHAGLADGATDRWQDLIRQMQNGFWFAHRRYRSKAQVHYGDVHALPHALGRFDVAVMGSILLHVKDPLGVVEACARISDRVVITDIHCPELDGCPVQRLYPTSEVPEWDTWWRFSAELFVRFLEVMGFETAVVTFHEQVHVSEGVRYPMQMMTVAADRRMR